MIAGIIITIILRVYFRLSKQPKWMLVETIEMMIKTKRTFLRT